MTLGKRVRLVVCWVLGLYLAYLFVIQGWDKFDPEGMWAGPFEEWGYPVWLRIVVGGVEVVGGIALLVPWVATWGGVSLAVIMTGAGVTRASGGHWVDVAWIVLYAVVCVWIAWEWRAWRRPRRAATPPPSPPQDQST
ncbi:MAG: DoxX family protein [Gemmatimonadota bacterium]